MTRKALLALTFLVLPLALLITAWSLASGTAALPWLAREIEARFPAINIEDATGSLLGDIGIRRVQIHAGNATVTLDGINTQLHWRCLLWGTVCVDELHVQHLTIATTSPATPTDKSTAAITLPPITLPIRLRWQHLVVDQLTFGDHSDAPHFDAIQSTGSWAGKRLLADSLRGRYRQTDIDLSGNIIFDANYPVDLRARVADEPLGVRLTADIGGDVARLFARTQIEQPVRAQANVAFEPLDRQLIYRVQASLLTPYVWGDATAPAVTVSEGATIELHGNRHALEGMLKLQASLPWQKLPVDLVAPLSFDIAQSQLTSTPTLQSGNTRVDGNVLLTLGSTSTLKIKANGNSIDPATWLDGYRGSLSAKADVELSWQDQLLSIVINDLRADGKLNDQVFDADFAGNWYRHDGWKLTRSNARLGENRAQMTASGREQNASLELAASTQDYGNLKLGCAISDLFETTIRSRCTQLAWQTPARWKIPPWRNRQPLQLAWQREKSQLMLAPFCLDGGNASVCSKRPLRWRPNEIDAAFEFSQIDLQWTRPWLPAAYALQGTAAGQIELNRKSGAAMRWSAKAVTEHARVQITTGNNTVRDNATANNTTGNNSTDKNTAADNNTDDNTTGKHLVTVPINRMHATIDSNDARIQASAVVDAGNFGTADAQLALMPDQQLSGRIALSDNQLAMLQPLLPDITINDGKVQALLQISGTVTKPLVSGSLQLDQGDVTTKQISTPIKDITAHVDITDTRATLQASANFNGQPVNASGDFYLQDSPHGSLHITARELHLKPLPRTDVWISPDITLTLQDGAAVIDGTVDMPRAYIILKQLPKSGVALSQDVSITDAETAMQKSLPISGGINLRLGDDVSFRGFGLQTKLAGNLGITLQDNQLRGNGRIALIEGRYRAYGQLLDIRSGDLLFVGPLDNPVIRIDAIRPDVPAPNVVGIRAEGELRNPDIVLFSTPAMSERARMQYLLTGRAPESEADSSGAIVGQALLAYGAGQSEGLVAGVADKFGVHDVSISTAKSDTGPQVQVSARLNSRLFFRYGKNVFDNTNEITMRYQLTHSLFVEAISGVASALDLLWSFEFGGE